MPKILKNQEPYDIAIVGAGLAGMTMAAAVCSENSALRVVLIDKTPPENQTNPSFDVRTTAISFGATEALARAGIMETLRPLGTEIHAIDVQDAHSPQILSFLSSNVGDQPFGAIFDNADLRGQLWAQCEAAIKEKKLDLLAPVTLTEAVGADDDQSTALHYTDAKGQEAHISARLVAAADGRFSTLRDWAEVPLIHLGYDQRALVGLVRHTKPHGNHAVERFMPDGPFAILPFSDDKDGTPRSAMVWTMTEGGIDYTKISETAFQIALEERFGDDYGEVTWASAHRRTYPLSLYHTTEMAAPQLRMALVGDTAHAIHPIAGQGLNMGLLDITAILDLIAQSRPEELGSAAFLRDYTLARRAGNFAMVAATDMLTRLFSNDMPPVAMARRLGLGAVQRLPFLKKAFMRAAMSRRKEA